MTDIEKIKDRLDIVDVISSYIEVKRAGANYRAICPFHNEKTPSLMINSGLQIFKCFGCGKGGDAIKFIQEIERLTFPEALQVAAERAGVELEKFQKPNSKLQKEKGEILKANELTANFYHYILNTHKLGEPGRKYAAKRNIGAKEIKDFMFGYAPQGKDNLKKFLIKKGFAEKDLINWGLLVERDYSGRKVVIDKFRERLMQPVRNIKGEVVGFSGRYVGENKDAPKYLNSPETPVFKKNEMLYGIFEGGDEIRKEKNAILVEGNIDIVSSHRVDIKNIIAPLGTAFTPNQAKLLKRFTDEVFITFDSDEAGFNATIRALEILENIGLKHKVIDVTGYQDADEMINKNKEEWLKRIKKPKNTIEFLLNKIEKQYDLKTADGKSQYSDKAVPILRLIKNPVQKSHFIQYLATMLSMHESAVEEMVNKNEKLKIKKSKLELEAPSVVNAVSKAKLSNHEKDILAIAIQTNHDFKFNFSAEDFHDENVGRFFDFIMHNRKLVQQQMVGASRDLLRLDEQFKEIFSELALRDLSKVAASRDTLLLAEKEIYKILHIEALNHKINELKKEYLEKDDDDKYLSTIAEIALEKRKLEKL